MTDTKKSHKKKPTTQVKPPSPTVKTVEIKKEELEDLGNCQGCGQPLKRTAFNSIMDAVRCLNPRCLLFRDAIRRIHRKAVRAQGVEAPGMTAEIKE